MKNGVATRENGPEIPQKLKIKLPYDSAILLLSIYPKEISTPRIIAALSTINAEGNGNPLQNSCLGNPMDRGVHHRSQTQLNNLNHHRPTGADTTQLCMDRWVDHTHTHTHTHTVRYCLPLQKKEIM